MKTIILTTFFVIFLGGYGSTEANDSYNYHSGHNHGSYYDYDCEYRYRYNNYDSTRNVRVESVTTYRNDYQPQYYQNYYSSYPTYYTSRNNRNYWHRHNRYR